MAEQQSEQSSEQNATAARFRSRKRGKSGQAGDLSARSFTRWARGLRQFISGDRAGKIALLFCLIGPAAILLGGLTGIHAALAALSCALTAVLCVLTARFAPVEESLSKWTMQQRFEQLEDMAWELSESEERYRTLAETFGDLMVMRDGSGKTIFANEAYRQIAAAEGELELLRSLPGAPVEDNTDKVETARDHPDETSNARRLSGREVCFGAGDQARWFHWVDLPVRNHHDGGTAVLSVAREITAFKQAERDQADARKKAEQASRAKSRFLAMVSHEMRTPLNGILGMSRLLSDTSLTAEQDNYNRALTHSADALLGLINGMLDMTMIEAGRFRLQKREFDPGELIRETGELMARRAHEKGLEFAISIPLDLPRSIYSDPDRIRQIIVNLSGNAVKFTNSGGVRLCVECVPVDGVGCSLQVTVEDTGPGISEEDAARIFNEFERAGTGGAGVVEGAGLGLAISAALAREMDGDIQLLESASTGSVFRFALPVKLEAGNDRSMNDIPGKGAGKAGEETAFILSKQFFEAAELERLLQNWGHTVSVFSSVSDLDEALNSHDRSVSARVFFDPQGFEDAIEIAGSIVRRLKKVDRLTLCLKPDDRHWFQRLKSVEGETWLTRPIRPESLRSLILGDYSQPIPKTGSELPQQSASNSRGLNAEETTAQKADVLLAEDNDINALLVISALRRAGIVVERVENGRMAVAQASHRLCDGNPYKVIFMDMQMPDMDGLQAIAEIRGLEERNGWDPVAIHMLTADEQETTYEQAIAVGADSVLVKPLEPSELVRLCSRDREGGARAAG